MSRALCLVDLPLLCVEWVDSHYRPGWSSGAADCAALRCVSVGWLVAEDAKGITLSANMSIEDAPQRCGDITIPAQAVVRRRKLR